MSTAALILLGVFDGTYVPPAPQDAGIITWTLPNGRMEWSAGDSFIHWSLPNGVMDWELPAG